MSLAMKQPDTSKSATIPPVDSRPDLHDLPNASFGQRSLAVMLDAFISGVFNKLLIALSANLSDSAVADGPSLSLVALALALNFAYYLVPLALWGQTLGKRLIGIRVISAERSGVEVVSFRRILLRETFGKLISTVCFGLGYFAVIWRQDKAAWHDHLCRTRVVSLQTEP